MLIGTGSAASLLAEADVRELVRQACASLPVTGKGVLVIIPDATRTAPIPLCFRLLYEALGSRVSRLDYLIALGTHPPMSDTAIDALVGVTSAERASAYPNVSIFNHQWDDPEALRVAGTIARDQAATLTSGLLVDEVTVALNRKVFEYDAVLIVGPVFPHEVAGFSGGAKYLFPGIAGADIINFTHWLGALVTSMGSIGVKDTPVRRVIDRAAAFVPTPITCFALALRGSDLHGLFVGDYEEAFVAAADLSAQLNIVTVPHAFRHVLSIAALHYDDLWTAAKAMYKTEPAIAEGGDVIIYAPHISEISYTHGALIDRVGYHVRDYFTQQEERFRDVPGAILAHSTHVKGAGSYDAASGIETPRITVTLATSIPEERCRRVNLGYIDYRLLDTSAWAGREDEGYLLVPNAGEVLYRAADLAR